LNEGDGPEKDRFDGMEEPLSHIVSFYSDGYLWTTIRLYQNTRNSEGNSDLIKKLHKIGDEIDSIEILSFVFRFSSNWNYAAATEVINRSQELNLIPESRTFEIFARKN
jgi:hypothetical protein